MSKMKASPDLISANVKRAEISAIVTRADGTVEDLGVICSQDFDKPSFFKRLAFWRK